MITYNPKDWFTFVFRVHKAETLKRLWPLLLGVGTYSAAWAYVETVLFKSYKSVSMVSNIGIIYSILGFTLSLFLVFRTNTAYDRWWEGRRLWGELTNAIRNLCIHLNAILPQTDVQRREYYQSLLSLFPTALRFHLQDRKIPAHFFSENPVHASIAMDINTIKKSRHQPQTIAKLFVAGLKADIQHGLMTHADIEHFKVEINKLMDVCGGCERIKNTPIPFTYSVFIKKFIFLYVMIFPIVYSTQLNFLIAPVTMFVLYVLASIELIAEEIEDPFNGDESDLPTEAISKNIKISTEELLLNR
ncbi:MAG: bestrophin family ion channel [Bacteroidetes bacterium]|nr:bestrophin family ion channel [Bacteroidota bacterium]MDA1224551.1 bestrophin family ion channel [Bacteroidota bacterium]